MFFALMFILWGFYLAMTANLEFSNLVFGFLIAVGLTWLFRPAPRKIKIQRLPTAVLALLKYILVLLVDMVKSGIWTARLLLDPDLPIKPGIIAIPSNCESELATALSAHAITLAPGELVIEIDTDGVMYTHTLDATRSAEYITEAQELRRDLLRKIFE